MVFQRSPAAREAIAERSALETDRALPTGTACRFFFGFFSVAIYDS